MDKDSLADQLLVLRCQARDDKAFGDLMARWEPPLYYYVKKIVGDENAALDILQETWLAVFKGLSRLDNAGRFAPWLYGVARHKAVDWLRKEHRYTEMADIEVEEPIEESPELSTGGLDAHAVHDALVSLTPEHREVLALFFLEDFSIGEMSEILGLPEGTVKSRLHYAKKNIHEILVRRERNA